MKLLPILCVLFAFLPIFIKPSLAESPVTSYDAPQEPSVMEMAYIYSNQFGVDFDTFYSVILCESGGDTNNIGDKGLAIGVLQFHESTFNAMSKEYGEVLDYHSANDQIKLGSWAFSKGYDSHWTTAVAIKKGGTYKFYSKQLQGNYTVRCKKQHFDMI